MGPLRQYWKQIVTPGPMRRRFARQAAQDTARRRMPPTIRPAFAERTALHDRLARSVTEAQEEGRGEFDAQSAQLRTLRSGFVEANLEKLDLYAAAVGVESRHPFMDIRLVQYCLALPSRSKLRDGWSRAVMRDAMGDRLPEMVRARMNKMHYGTQNRTFVFESEPGAVQSLLDHPGAASDYLDMDEVRALWRRGQAHPESLSEWEIAWFSAAITAILWMRLQQDRS